MISIFFLKIAIPKVQINFSGGEGMPPDLLDGHGLFVHFPNLSKNINTR